MSAAVRNGQKLSEVGQSRLKKTETGWNLEGVRNELEKKFSAFFLAAAYQQIVLHLSCLKQALFYKHGGAKKLGSGSSMALKDKKANPLRNLARLTSLDQQANRLTEEGT